MKQYGGLWWPERDENGHIIIPAETSKLLTAVALSRGRRTAVQAGGNVGIFPLLLAEHFQQVLTFEPNPECYACLMANTASNPRIEIHHAALGMGNEPVGFDEVWPGNCGAGQVKGRGSIPQHRIDDFELTDVDLIQLDVEGFESKAIIGAAATIEQCRPILMIEDRGHQGSKIGELPHWISEQFNYTIAAHREYDVILQPSATQAL